MHRWITCSLAVAAAVTVAAPAVAQTSRLSGAYVGGSIGKPDWRNGAPGVTGGDSGGTAGKLYGGWQFTPNFGVELGAVDLGKLEGSNGNARANGAYVDAVGTLPLANDFSLIGRVGAVNAKLRTPTGSDRGTQAKVGAGLQYNLSRNTAIRGEWERYGLKGQGAKPKADLYSIGLNYAF